MDFDIPLLQSPDRLGGYKFWFPIPENMGVGFGTVFLSGIQAEL